MNKEEFNTKLNNSIDRAIDWGGEIGMCNGIIIMSDELLKDVSSIIFNLATPEEQVRHLVYKISKCRDFAKKRLLESYGSH